MTAPMSVAQTIKEISVICIAAGPGLVVNVVTASAQLLPDRRVGSREG